MRWFRSPRPRLPHRVVVHLLGGEDFWALCDCAAVESAGVARPARLYDLRSTFASNALAAGVTVFELGRIMGTSTRMIDLHYGALLDTANESLLERLDRGFGALEGHGREVTER
jgi:hypothetical protein